MMLGAVEIALHAKPELDPADMADAVRNQEDLGASGLDQQQPPVRLVPVPVSLEELSRFWSGFFNAPYTLSTVWDASAVILSEAHPTLAAGLPVRGPGVKGGQMPPELSAFAEPVTYAAGLRVPVSGRGVEAGQYAGIGSSWSDIESAPAGDLAFKLPTDTPAGTHAVRLGTKARGAASPAPIPGSMAQQLVIRPELRSVARLADGTTVRATVRPDVQPGQQVALNLLNDATTGDHAGGSLRLTAATTQTGDSIDFTLPPRRSGQLPAGRYLATIEVDGAASLPVYSGGKYSAPKVTIR
jgi:hypothetical protein